MFYKYELNAEIHVKMSNMKLPQFIDVVILMLKIVLIILSVACAIIAIYPIAINVLSENTGDYNVLSFSLSFLTLLVTIITFGLGLLGVIGYKTIIGKATLIAKRHSRETLEKNFSEYEKKLEIKLKTIEKQNIEKMEKIEHDYNALIDDLNKQISEFNDLISKSGFKDLNNNGTRGKDGCNI